MESASRLLIRPIAFPGSHIPYVVGEQEIRSLRRNAKLALGNRFDVRDFHEFILKDGPVPLWFMRENVESGLPQRPRGPLNDRSATAKPPF
jgi:uncharacterized protein (DUF885 family)